MSAISQEENKKGNYSEILNDPYAIPNFEIKISPIWLGYSQQNMMTLGWGIGTEFALGKKFIFDANYNSTYTKISLIIITQRVSPAPENQLIINILIKTMRIIR